MPSLRDLKQSKFLAKEDCMPAILATIQGYEQVNVAMENQAPDMKYALNFKENIKPLVLNQTNGALIAGIAGNEDFDSWVGVQIVLYNDPNVSFAGKITGGIRVRAPKNQTPPEQYQPPVAEEPDDENIPF